MTGRSGTSQIFQCPFREGVAGRLAAAGVKGIAFRTVTAAIGSGDNPALQTTPGHVNDATRISQLEKSCGIVMQDAMRRQDDSRPFFPTAPADR